MPFNPNSVPKPLLEELIEAVQRRSLVPFVGAGVSRQSGHNIPTRHDLINKMIDLASKGKYINQIEEKKMRRYLGNQQVLIVAEALRHRLPIDVYRNFLVEMFTPKETKGSKKNSHAIYKALFGLRPPLILTTNYDSLLEDAYAEQYHQAAPVYTHRRADAVQRASMESRENQRPVIFKIHGSISEPSEMILTELDYRKSTYDQLSYSALLSTLFLTNNVLMIGFSPTDRELTMLLDTLRQNLRDDASPDYIFLPSDLAESKEALKFKETYNIEVISYDPSKGDAAMLEFLDYLAAQAK
jgi:hypothetical protein